MKPWVRRATAVVLVVATWSSGVAVATTRMLRDDAPVVESAVAALSQARVGCGLAGVDRAGELTRLRVVDLKAGPLRCLLDRVGAPEYLLPGIASTWPLDGRKTASWGSVTVRWFRSPVEGLDVTVTVLA